jgi:hypothetical protein
MTVYIGVDFHARQQTISYLTTEEGAIQHLVLLHDNPVRCVLSTRSSPVSG